MSEIVSIAAALHDPRLLEDLYRKAVKDGHGGAWAAEIDRLYAQSPGNPVLAAWHCRLQPEAEGVSVPQPAWRVHWKLAVPLGLVVGAIYWLLTDPRAMLTRNLPYLFFLWAPIAAAAIIAFVVRPASAGKTMRALAALLGMGALAAYVVWVVPTARTHYKELAVMHLPIVALLAVGLSVAGPGSDDGNRFAFLIKATEAVVTGGIIGGASVIFLAITIGIFAAIGVVIPDELGRLLVSLALGLVVMLAVALVYDARFAPLEQRFEDGMSKLIATLGRFFLPLTLIVAVIYVASIPFNFWRPFEQRDVLIVYNLMLFAVMGLLVFATPVATAHVPPAVLGWLRRGIVSVAALALLVSLYALAATLYRTAVLGGWTTNRLTIIGWNIVNMAILAYLLYGQWRTAAADWLAAVYRACRLGAILYALWTVFLLLALPWLFPL